MKRVFKKIFTLLFGFAIIMVAEGAQAEYIDRTGDYEVGSGFVGPEDAYYVYYPLDMEENNHPIVVFCSGTNGTPHNVIYQFFLKQYASHGMVVIGGNDTNQNTDNGRQTAMALNWLIAQNTIDMPENIFYGKLITDKIVVIGHSQGGAAAVNIANNDIFGVEVPEVTAIVNLMGGNGQLYSNGDRPDFERVDAPILFIAASWDWIRPPRCVLKYYTETVDTPAWYGCYRYTGHLWIGEPVQKIVRAWLFTHLYDDPDAQNVFYGEDWTFKEESSWKDQQRKHVQ